MNPAAKEETPYSVLLVDNDSDFVRTARYFLCEHGYSIEMAPTGYEAITKVKSTQYGVVLLNIDHIDRDGLTLFHSLIHFVPEVPIVVLASHPSQEEKMAFLKGGAFDFLSKPYTIYELKATLRRALMAKSLGELAHKWPPSLVASEDRFRAIVEAATDAIILSDRKGNVLSWNRSAQRMFGYRPEEIMGRPLTLLMPDRFREAHQKGLERAQLTGEMRIVGKTIELHGLRKNGEEFPIELSLSRSVLTGEVFYCGIIRDISERLKTAKALEESERHFQLTIDNINDAVVYGDLSGNVLWANQQWAKLLGRPMDEIVGHPFMEYLTASTASLAKSRLALVRQGGEVPPLVEFEVARRDGTSRWVEANVTSVSRDHEVVGRLLVGRDITERKRTELELEESNRLLALDAEVARVLNQNLELQTLLQRCTEALVAHLKAALARIWILKTEEQMLVLQASAGMYTHLDGSHSRVPVGQFKIGQIALEKRPMLTNAVVGDPRVPEQEWAKREGLVAFAGFPFLQNDEVLGVMALFARHPLTDFTLKSLGMVADRITAAIGARIALAAHAKIVKLNDHILASTEEGIYGLDREGRTTFANPAAAKMTGWTVGELIGKYQHDILHHTKPDGTPYPEEACQIYAAFRDGKVHHIQNEVFWRKDGTSFPVEYTSTPIWDDKKLTGAVVIFKDISPRKQA